MAAFILEIEKLGPTGPLPGKKVGTLQKNVGPQVITHLIGLVSPLLAMLSLVRHCESLAPVKSLLNFEQEKSLSHED